MKLHEYQAKALLAKYGVPVPRGEVASSLDEVRRIAKSHQGKCVVKVQIHAGGRGKSGGVKLIIAFFLFYLIRDSILYILPIYLGMQGIQSCVQ